MTGRVSRSTLTVAAMAVVSFFGLEVANALANTAGSSWPWKRPVAVLLAVVASIAVLRAMVAVRRDRTALRTVLDELSASERQHAGITSIAADAIITMDERQAIVLFNQGAESMFGWSSSDVIGKPLAILLPERLRAVHAHHVSRFATGADVARRMGQRQEIVGQRRGGSEFPAEASISRLDLPNRRLFTVVLRDVTDRHRQARDEHFLAGAGATLNASLDYESTLLSAVHLAIPHLADCCILDLVADDGMTRRIASVHDDPDQTKRLRALEHRHETPRNWPFPTATVLATQAVASGPLAPIPDGIPTVVREAVAGIGVENVTSLPLLARGRLVGVLSLVTTERERLLDADRLKVAESVSKLIALAIDNATLYQTAQRATVARDEVLGAVSHDLRNPLAAILMCARVLQSENQVPNRGELTDAIIESADMMNRMIQDLLDVATIESGHLRVDPSPQRLDALLDRVLEMTRSAAHERHIEVNGVVPSRLPPVMVDSTRLIQVLANLVSNAVKFTESGGRVSVTAEQLSGRVMVAVRDTGVGIPAAHLPHIFDRHWHSRRSGRTAGTGLGLAIAQGIVEAHGDRIRVDSTEGVGSTFSFTVPLAPDADATTATSPP